MAGKGPPRKPTALLRLNGSWRGVVRDRTEPRPAEGIPDCPSYLPEEGKQMWARIVAACGGIGLITLADREMLAACCDAWALLVDAIKAGDSRLRIEAGKLFRQQAAEFGLTPASRSRVNKVEVKPPADAKKKFFGGA